MMSLVILEDRLGNGQENSDQLINQYETIIIYCEPHNLPTILTPDQISINLKLPSDMNREFHIIPGRSHWRAHYV